MLCGSTNGHLSIFSVEKKCLLKKIRMVWGKGCPNLIKLTKCEEYAVICTTDRNIYKLNIKRGTILKARKGIFPNLIIGIHVSNVVNQSFYI